MKVKASKPSSGEDEMYDLIIKNGMIIDGKRGKPFHGDVCVSGDTIAAVGPAPGAEAALVIDAQGQAVCPGFIDIHSHSDSVPFSPNLCDSKLQQGVTTELCGNCGSSAVPAASPDAAERVRSVRGYTEAINRTGHLLNTATLIGHSNLRLCVMGFTNRAPDEREQQALEALLDRELSDGAFGMSLGLIYPPSAFSGRDELVRLARVTASHDALLAVHMRNEGNHVFDSVREMLSIAGESGVRLEISHLKLMGKPQWGKAPELLNLIRDARAAGIRVTCDQYPFCASSTSLKALLPHEAQDGGKDALLTRLSDPTEELMETITAQIAERGGAETILVADAARNPHFNNRFLSDVAAGLSLSPAETVVHLLRVTGASVRAIYFCIDEIDMLTILPELYISVGTDAASSSYDPLVTKYVPHPRNYATYPRYFSEVRKHGLLPLEDAVYKCTGLPASVMGLTDRGVLEPGRKADIVVFDPETFRDHSDYAESRVKPTGLSHVVINGKPVLRDGSVIERRAGRALVKE